MKKLVIAMSCFAAIFLTSSCTADSPIETKNENFKTLTKTPTPETETDVFANIENDKDSPRP